MTLSDAIAVAGSVEILALLVVVVALGSRGRKAVRLELEPRADAAVGSHPLCGDPANPG